MQYIIGVHYFKRGMVSSYDNVESYSNCAVVMSRVSLICYDSSVSIVIYYFLT